jgi:hypothetical protein
MMMADLNGDGALDLVVANEDDNRMYFNKGDGTFSDESARLPLTGKREVTREVFLADADGDGDQDIVFFNNNGLNRLLMNDGKGNFSDQSAKRLPPIKHRTWDGALYDVDDDGDLDIISANSTSKVGAEKFHVLINDGHGYFTDQPDLFFPAELKESGWDVEAADLNGDGLLDFYLCGRANNKDGDGSQDRLLFGIRKPEKE